MSSYDEYDQINEEAQRRANETGLAQSIMPASGHSGSGKRWYIVATKDQILYGESRIVYPQESRVTR